MSNFTVSLNESDKLFTEGELQRALKEADGILCSVTERFTKKILNATDEDGVNSSMTDVFGVAATGLELIPPRQFMVRLSMSY